MTTADGERQLGLSVSYKDLSNKDSISGGGCGEGSGVVQMTNRNTEQNETFDMESEGQENIQRGYEDSDSGAGIMRQDDGGTESFGLLGQNNCGTLKKNILNSPFNFLFVWATAYAPGTVVFWSLLLSMMCGSVASAVMLFAPSGSLCQPITIMMLGVLIAVAIASLSLITAFNQDTSITTFKVRDFSCFQRTRREAYG